jgi:hypothetical protein
MCNYTLRSADIRFHQPRHPRFQILEMDVQTLDNTAVNNNFFHSFFRNSDETDSRL